MSKLQRIAISADQLSDRQLSLTAQQQHYLVRVLRLRQGDRFIAMDGWQWWLAELNPVLQTAKILELVEVQTELAIAVTLLLSLPKTGMDDVVRQVTELGVAEILPVVSQYSLLQPSPRKQERWHRIAQEAAEQSERQVIPRIAPVQSFVGALSVISAEGSPQSGYLCVARGASCHLWTALQQVELNGTQKVIVAIGPEGGWTEAEVQTAIDLGYLPVSLGNRILRSITAPVVLMSLISAYCEL